MVDVNKTVNKALEPVEEMGWQPRVYAVGGVVGLALGLLTAYFYVRAVEEKGTDVTPETPSAGDTIRLGVSLLGIVRTITEWGAR